MKVSAKLQIVVNQSGMQCCVLFHSPALLLLVPMVQKRVEFVKKYFY
ncbi:MAG: hypothetical protein KDK39_09875 [Leptospiraceae bacterium]|nr:hypothetical protein [Leptospiraceae bacterium]